VSGEKSLPKRFPLLRSYCEFGESFGWLSARSRANLVSKVDGTLGNRVVTGIKIYLFLTNGNLCKRWVRSALRRSVV